LPDPDEGSAFNGWTGLDERRRKCRPDNVRCEPPVQAKKCGGCVTNRRGGAPEGARAGSAARGRLRQGAQLYLAPYRRSASLREAREDPSGGSGGRDKMIWRSARFRRVEVKPRAWRNERMKSCLLAARFDLSRCEDKVPAA